MKSSILLLTHYLPAIRPINKFSVVSIYWSLIENLLSKHSYHFIILLFYYFVIDLSESMYWSLDFQKIFVITLNRQRVLILFMK